MQRNAAKFGISSGTGVGSGFTQSRTLRDLGVSTLQRQQLGLNNAQNWIRQTAAMTTPNMFNMTSMFLTPESVFKMDFENQMAQFQRDWKAEQLDWGSDWKTLTGKAISDMGGSISSMGSFGMGSGGSKAQTSSSFIPMTSTPMGESPWW